MTDPHSRTAALKPDKRLEVGLVMEKPLRVEALGLGLLVSQLNNYTLAPISEERISEAAGVNSAGGSFGLSFGSANTMFSGSPSSSLTPPAPSTCSP